MANDQADEESDGVGDACDNCPLDVNTAQANGDDDALGDACDPRPATSGDVLLAFDNFNTFNPAWQTVAGGTWSVSNGSLSSPGASNGNLLRLTGVSATNVLVVADVTWPFLASPNSASAGVVTRVNGDDGMVCNGFKSSTLQRLNLAGMLDNNASFGLDENDFGGPFFDTRFRLRATANGNDYTCELPGVVDGALSSSSFNGTGIALRSNRLPMIVHAIAVYGF